MKAAWMTAVAVSALAMMSVPQSAGAQGYVGLGIGSSHLNADCSGTTACDNNDTGFKVFGGFKFAPNVAGEITYLDFGKAKASVASGSGTINGELKTSGIGLGVAFMGEFSPEWSGVARLGVMRVKSKVSGSLGSMSGSDSDTTTQAHLGLGVSYAVSKAMSIDASVDFSKSKYAGDSGNVRLIGVGLTFGF